MLHQHSFSNFILSQTYATVKILLLIFLVTDIFKIILTPKLFGFQKLLYRHILQLKFMNFQVNTRNALKMAFLGYKNVHIFVNFHPIWTIFFLHSSSCSSLSDNLTNLPHFIALFELRTRNMSIFEKVHLIVI